METNVQENNFFTVDYTKFKIPILIISAIIIGAIAFVVYQFYSLFLKNLNDRESINVLLVIVPCLLFVFALFIAGFAIWNILSNPIQRIIVEKSGIRIITRKNSEYYVQPENIQSIVITYTYNPRRSMTTFTFLIDNRLFARSGIKESFSFSNYHLNDTAQGKYTTEIIQFLQNYYSDKVKLNNINWSSPK